MSTIAAIAPLLVIAPGFAACRRYDLGAVPTRPAGAVAAVSERVLATPPAPATGGVRRSAAVPARGLVVRYPGDAGAIVVPGRFAWGVTR